MKKNEAVNIIALVLVTILALASLFPIYWMIKGGLESTKGAMKVPPDFLPRIDLRNYLTIFTKYRAFRWFANSAIIALAATFIIVFCSCLSGYAFAKKEFPGKNFLFWLILLTLMIPYQVTIIPLFITMRSLNMINTYPGVFLPLSCGVSGMFLARQYMSTLPSELIDSARIDGASELRIFLSVILPISKPLVAALTIFSFVITWNNFIWPLIMTTTSEMRTLPVAIATISAMPNELIDIGMAMAGATLAAIPMYIVFFAFQKCFVKGITLGGVKG